MCSTMHRGLANRYAASVSNAFMMAARMAPAASGTTGVHCLNQAMGAPCPCPEHGVHQSAMGGPSHTALTHAADAALLYLVADVRPPVASKKILRAIAAPIQAIPPPHSILHCVLLI